MVGKSYFPHFYFTVIPISIVWCQIETLVVWKFLRAVKNLLSAFFCWFSTLYIEIHIKKNNVNKSLADRHTFQCIYVCRKRETVLFNGIFLVFFSNSYERTCQINMLQNLVLYDIKWYKVSIVWNKMNSL